MQRDTCALMFFLLLEKQAVVGGPPAGRPGRHAQLPPMPRADRAGCSPCAASGALPCAAVAWPRRRPCLCSPPPLLVLPRYRFTGVTPRGLLVPAQRT